MAKDLLLEIGTEEMPANYMEGVRRDFRQLAAETFSQHRLSYTECQVFSTPRRITLYMTALNEMQEDRHVSVKGPAVTIGFDEEGNPTKAALGFARGQGVSVDELVTRDGYLYADKVTKGQQTEKVLTEILPSLIKKISFPKSMRWGDYDFRFIRPIKWLLALYGNEVVNFSLTGVTSGQNSRGHRFLVEEPLYINNPQEYFDKLKDGLVIVDHQKRREMVLEQTKELNLEKGKVLVEEELLNEVMELIEYPTVFYGSFDREFLKLPEEVLITSMAEHQRYFPVVDKEGKLLPYFVGVRDGIKEGIEEVKKGNEMVLKARLADARFFFEEDLKTGFDQRQEKLKEIVFQEKLGSMYDKVLRLEEISLKLAQLLNFNNEDLKIVKQAARLSKNDLVSEMVNEFDKLQGVMGREYALLNGEIQEVAVAIYEQYLPRYAGDKLPQTKYGQILSLADKLDNICCHFSLGHIPTGSQDPFALRRQAIGIVKIVLENNLGFNISELITTGLNALKIEDKDIYEKIKEFLLQRVNNILEDEGIRYDIIKAVISAEDEDLTEIMDRAKAIMELRDENPDLFVALVRGLVRASNLARQLEAEVELKQEYLQTAEEKELYNDYQELKGLISGKFNRGEYLEGLKSLVELKKPIDNFLDNVVVMVDDEALKNNRLALLKELTLLVKPVMDIDKITLD
jgi:glycyl-tRNA synthetase beta chain